MTDMQPVPEQHLQNLQITNFAEFSKKFELPDHSGFELVETRRADSFLPPQPTPVHKLSMTSMVWNISIGQLVCLSVLPPSSCTPAH